VVPVPGSYPGPPILAPYGKGLAMDSHRFEWTQWPVAWSAIWVGALTALAVGLIIGLLGFAVGANEVARYVDWHKVRVVTVIFSSAGAFFAFVAGGWTANQGREGRSRHHRLDGARERDDHQDRGDRAQERRRVGQGLCAAPARQDREGQRVMSGISLEAGTPSGAGPSTKRKARSAQWPAGGWGLIVCEAATPS
jgi:hypothetical protein